MATLCDWAAANRSAELSPVKSSPPNCCQGIAKSSVAHVKAYMIHACLSSCELLIFFIVIIFFNDVSKKNQ